MKISPSELQAKEMLKDIPKIVPGCAVNLKSVDTGAAIFLLRFKENAFAKLSFRSLKDNLASKLAGRYFKISVYHAEADNTVEIRIDTVPMTEEPINILSVVKDEGVYTHFKLKSSKLTIDRRGKPVTFKRGDPLGWRFSASGTHLRLISPLYGKTIVFSIKIDDKVLRWLDEQDPKAKAKVGQRKSDKPEDSLNKLEGYVITDGKAFYKLTPKPVMVKGYPTKAVLYAKEQNAQRDAAPFKVAKKLKVIPVYTKDLLT